MQPADNGGQCRAGPGRRRSIGRLRASESDKGDRATWLCTAESRFRRRRHCGERRGGTRWSSPGQTVVTVARPDVREAVVDIGPDFPVPLRIGLPFTVSLQLLPTIQVEGQIREIAPQADPVTRTVSRPYCLERSASELPAWNHSHCEARQTTRVQCCGCPTSGDPLQRRRELRLGRRSPRQHGFAAQGRSGRGRRRASG